MGCKNKQPFIARDRLGIKPLYYTNIRQRFIYASELKVFLTTPNIDDSVDLNCIADFLRIGYIPSNTHHIRPLESYYQGTI